MGRAKIAMEFITKEKSRNSTYVKRKKGLIKKCHEFSILCNVPLCIIIYPYKEGKQLSFQPEVYAFPNRDENEEIAVSNELDLARARDPEVIRRIINRYLAVPKEEKGRRALNLCDMLADWKRKADQELNKLRQKNALVKYPSWDPTLYGFTQERLIGLLENLDHKLGIVRQRIDFIKGSQVVEHASLGQFYDPNNVNCMGCIDHNLEVANPFSMFNYLDCNQFNPFDLSGFPGQVEPTRVVEHDGIGGGIINNNLVVYNMNKTEMGPSYYNLDHQGSGVFDCTGEDASTSYSNTSLPMSRLQLQMFYDN